MNNDFLQLVSAWLENTWVVLTTFHFPGTKLSPAVLLIGGAAAVFSLRLLGYIFGFSVGSGQQRGGNNTKIKVSQARKDDEK